MNKNALRTSFSLLNADYVQLNRDWNYKNITSTFYRLYLVSDGGGQVYNIKDTQLLEPGNLYLIPSFTPCSYTCEKHLRQYYLSMMEDVSNVGSLFAFNRRLMKVNASEADYNLFERLIQINPNRGLYTTHDPEIYEKRPVLQNFQELNNELSLAARTETNGIILQLLARFLAPEHFKTGYSVQIPSRIYDAIDFIQTNLSATLTISQLADRAHQNADYFSRLFMKSTGERPLKYIQAKRVERAQTLLSTTNLPLSEIAYRSGFQNAAYLSRIFKQITSMTPGEYKKSSML